MNRRRSKRGQRAGSRQGFDRLTPNGDRESARGEPVELRALATTARGEPVEPPPRRSPARGEPVEPHSTTPRTLKHALTDALPSLIAATACGLAWLDPRLFGIDLLRTAAPLFFLELPLAILFVFADTWRVPTEQLPRTQKLTYILVPGVVIGALCWKLFGVDGLIAVAWLGGSMFWRFLRHGEDRRVTGRWLIVRGQERWTTRTKPDRKSLPDAWILPLADNEFLPALSIFACIGLALVLFTGVEVPFGGATPDYAARVGWTATPVGSVIPAHEALAAGLALFVLRAVGFFDEILDRVESASGDDATVREIIDTVERQHRKRP